MKYSEEAFAEKFNFTIGFVKQLRKRLTNFGVLSRKNKLNDEHYELVLKATKIKDEQQLTWDEAFEIILEDENLIGDYDENDQKLIDQLNGIIDLNEQNVLNETQTLAVIKKLLGRG